MEIITVATILMASLNAFNNVSEYVYNTEGSDNVVTSTVVYKKSEGGKYLSHYLKYNYTYDEQQRLVKKEALKWNLYSEKWENSYCLDYIYDASGYSIEYALWNRVASDYTDVVAKQTYAEKMDGVMAVASYKWNNKGNGWVIEDNIVMMNPGNALLSSLEMEF